MPRRPRRLTPFPYTTLFRSHDAGVRHFRLGGQSCFWTYKAIGVGLTDEPKPNVPATERLLVGVKGSEEHTSELQSPCNLVCRLLLEKKKKKYPNARKQHTRY